ncbi:MAG: DUF4956 domain-containing protein [Actinomycetota bacterium]
MSTSLIFALDLVAISVLIFALYFPRHRRKDLVAAYLGVNVGVLAVADALSSSEIGAGLGIGLFGVLSIIRLRSTELDHEEVAYYFAALALGLLGGLAVGPDWLTPALMGAVMLALFVGDHPRLFSGYRTQVVHLDVAITDEATLIGHLEALLGATVHRVKVRKVDLVNDTTNVEVRYRIGTERGGASADSLPAGSAVR